MKFTDDAPLGMVTLMVFESPAQLAVALPRKTEPNGSPVMKTGVDMVAVVTIPASLINWTAPA